MSNDKKITKSEKKVVQETIKDKGVTIESFLKEKSKDDTDYQVGINTLMNEKYKRRKTILSDDQVAVLTTLDVLAQLYDIPFLKAWVDWFAEWKTSGGGGIGRKDIVEISKFSYAENSRRHTEMLDMLRGK